MNNCLNNYEDFRYFKNVLFLWIFRIRELYYMFFKFILVKLD